MGKIAKLLNVSLDVLWYRCRKENIKFRSLKEALKLKHWVFKNKEEV